MDLSERAIMHLDMDAFFASVEQRDNPELKGKPVLVCGDPDGRTVVAAASYEARPYGVHSGMPLGTARKLCPKAILVEGNPSKYISLSSRIFKLMKEYTPFVEPYSIDEGFCDLSGIQPFYSSPQDVALSMKTAIKDRFELTASAGLAPNKLLAKICSSQEKPDGFTKLQSETDFLEQFGDHPVSLIWGIGAKTERRLLSLGISTVRQLSQFPYPILKRYFGVWADLLHAASHGKDTSPVEPYYTEHRPKSMGHEITFPRDLCSEFHLLGYLLFLCEKTARRLRLEGMIGRVVTVKIRWSNFITITRQSCLSEPTDCDDIIYVYAKKLLLDNWNRQSLRLLGVSVSGLNSNPFPRQLHLFSQDTDQRRSDLLKAVDPIKDKFGERAIGRWISSNKHRTTPSFRCINR